MILGLAEKVSRGNLAAIQLENWDYLRSLLKTRQVFEARSAINKFSLSRDRGGSITTRISTNAQEQIVNVFQLTDVSPGDWAFEALRSLVERYGCIAGYPDRTFRGNRALTRWEFAAGLNACMNQIERWIAASEAVLREDLEKLRRLSEEFQAELVRSLALYSKG